jgi:hypothetical protein
MEVSLADPDRPRLKFSGGRFLAVADQEAYPRRANGALHPWSGAGRL